MTPEHLHLMLNHFPVIGVGVALLPILVGLITHSKPALLSGLAIAACCSWLTPVVMESGEGAYERYKAGPVTPYLDAEAYEALEIHEHRAHDWSKIIYANAVVATLGFLLILLKQSYAEKVAWVAVLLGIVSLASGIWIAESGGKIRRPDFRMEEVSTDSHDD